MQHITYDRQAALKLFHRAISDSKTWSEFHAALVPLKEQQRWRNDPLLLKPKLIDAWLVPLRRAIAEWLRNVADVLED